MDELLGFLDDKKAWSVDISFVLFWRKLLYFIGSQGVLTTWSD